MPGRVGILLCPRGFPAVTVRLKLRDGAAKSPCTCGLDSEIYKYPQEVRRLIYTTNAIEGFNRQLRKVTKAKSVFPTDDSLLKMLYLAMIDITKKWTGRRQDWSMIHAQLAVFFADRMPE